MYSRPSNSVNYDPPTDETELQAGLNLLAKHPITSAPPVSSTTTPSLTPTPHPPLTLNTLSPDTTQPSPLSTPASDKSDYRHFRKTDLGLLCEARGISITDKNKTDCVLALEKDEFHQGPEGNYRFYQTEHLKARLQGVYGIKKEGNRKRLITELWQQDASLKGQAPPVHPIPIPLLAHGLVCVDLSRYTHPWKV